MKKKILSDYSITVNAIVVRIHNIIICINCKYDGRDKSAPARFYPHTKSRRSESSWNTARTRVPANRARRGSKTRDRPDDFSFPPFRSGFRAPTRDGTTTLSASAGPHVGARHLDSRTIWPWNPIATRAADRNGCCTAALARTRPSRQQSFEVWVRNYGRRKSYADTERFPFRFHDRNIIRSEFSDWRARRQKLFFYASSTREPRTNR